MISHQIALLKREIWEHRSIWITPIAVASVLILGTLMAWIFLGKFADELNAVLFGAQNMVGEEERSIALSVFFFGTSGLFFLSLAILTTFYCLDSLYAERKDKSILFWRSLPVTDAETVVSKLATALLVIPAATIIAIVATHIVNLIFVSIWVSSKGGDAGHLIWSSVSLFSDWFSLTILVYASVIWMSPFVGWFLFVSAFAKRLPFMLAFLPLLIIPMLEGIVLRSNEFAKAVWGRVFYIPIHGGGKIDQWFDDDSYELSEQMIKELVQIDVVNFVTSPSVWVGLLVCGLLTFGAIYVRRFRDES